MADEAYIISPANQDLFKDSVLKYLNGTYTIDETRNSMLSACKYQSHRISAKALAKSIELSARNEPSLDPQIAEILLHLKMKTQKRHYVENGILSLYDLLREQKNKNLDYLLEMIDDVYPPPPLFNYIYRPAVITIGILSFSYLQPQYFWMAIDWVIDILPTTYYWLQHYVVQLNNWPVIGMSMQIAWLIYYVHYTFQHGLDPSNERIRNLTFRAIALTFTFLGHLLAYSAGGSLSWGPALFFIAGSMVSIVESIYFYATQGPARFTQNPDVHSQAQDIRHKKTQDRNFYYFLVRLIHAIAITALLLICTVLPPSLILTMVYTLTLSLSFWLKDVCIEHIKYTTGNDEQAAIATHYKDHENTLEKKREEQKGEFQKYATAIIVNYNHDPAKQVALREEMQVLLGKDNFSLQNAKEIFSHCITYGDKVSPSPQSQSISQSIFGFHNKTPNKALGAGTPLRGAKLTEAYTPEERAGEPRLYNSSSISATK